MVYGVGVGVTLTRLIKITGKITVKVTYKNKE